METFVTIPFYVKYISIYIYTTPGTSNKGQAKNVFRTLTASGFNSRNRYYLIFKWTRNCPNLTFFLGKQHTKGA